MEGDFLSLITETCCNWSVYRVVFHYYLFKNGQAGSLPGYWSWTHCSVHIQPMLDFPCGSVMGAAQQSRWGWITVIRCLPFFADAHVCCCSRWKLQSDPAIVEPEKCHPRCRFCFAFWNEGSSNPCCAPTQETCDTQSNDRGLKRDGEMLHESLWGGCWKTAKVVEAHAVRNLFKRCSCSSLRRA